MVLGKRRVLSQAAPASRWNPPPAGKEEEEARLNPAGHGAKRAGPGLPPRPQWAPEYPSKTGPHSNREGPSLQQEAHRTSGGDSYV